MKRFTNAASLVATGAVLALALSVLAFAQGGSISGQVIQPPAPTGTGGPASLATVRVCPYSTGSGTPCSPTQTLYSDPALTQSLGNQTSTDQYGNYSVFVPVAYYLVQVTPINGITYSYTVLAEGGTVTSIGLSMPSGIFSVTPSTITSSGVFNVTLLPQSSNTIFANCTLSSTTPSFCALTAAMIPSTLNATAFNGPISSTGTATFPALVLNGSQTLVGLQGTFGTKLADASGSWTNGHLLSANSTSDIVDSTLALSNIPLLNASNTFTGATNTFAAISATTISATLVTAATLNATTGYEIGGSFGTSGYCLTSTGSGSAYASCPLPMYEPNGTALTGGHIVTFAVNLSGGTATVNFTGSAQFVTHAFCTASDYFNPQPVQATLITVNQLVLTGSSNDGIMFICVGN